MLIAKSGRCATGRRQAPTGRCATGRAKPYRIATELETA